MFNDGDLLGISWKAYTGEKRGDFYEFYPGGIEDFLDPNFHLAANIKELIMKEGCSLKHDLHSEYYAQNEILRAYVGKETTIQALKDAGYKIDNQNGKFTISMVKRAIVSYNEKEKIATIQESLGKEDFCFETAEELENYLREIAKYFSCFQQNANEVKKLLKRPQEVK